MRHPSPLLVLAALLACATVPATAAPASGTILAARWNDGI